MRNSRRSGLIAKLSLEAATRLTRAAELKATTELTPADVITVNAAEESIRGILNNKAAPGADEK